MSKEKLLNAIENKLENLHSQINRVSSKGKFHKIDIDLFKTKTIEIYEMINQLDQHPDFDKTEPGRTYNLPERMPKAEIPEVSKSKETEKEASPKVELEQPDSETEDEKVVEQPETKEAVVEETKQKPAVDKPEAQTDKEHQTTETAENIRSTFDLFTESAEKRIGDKLGSDDESSIADKMQKSRVNDLRQVIGINEKFLFINELFNGDMSKYNKVVDELNELTTPQGIDSYLIELKVANLWADDNEAYQKLKELLGRKTN